MTAVSPPKDPGLAAVLSFFVTRLGQIYNGPILKGLIFFAISLHNVLLMSVLIGLHHRPFVLDHAIYDGYRNAERINRGRALGWGV
jgi:TM2 domain-containing membrane protein YozV